MRPVSLAGFISEVQLHSYEHPLIKGVAEAAESGTDVDLKQALIMVVLSGRLNFLPLPFSPDSLLGKRVKAAWKACSKPFPWIDAFVLRFWNPELDTESVVFMSMATGQFMVRVAE